MSSSKMSSDRKKKSSGSSCGVLSGGGSPSRMGDRSRKRLKKTSSTSTSSGSRFLPMVGRSGLEMPSKPTRLVSLESLEGGDSDEEGSEDEIRLMERSGETINVSFDFSDFSNGDFHGTRALLRRGGTVMSLLLNYGELDDLTEAAVSQVEVGTTVKADGAVFGFGTALLLNEKRHEESSTKKKKKTKRKASFREAIRRVVTQRCDATLTSKVNGLLDSSALVINERVLNFPFQLVPALHDNLCSDIEWACSVKNAGASAEAFKKVTHLLLLSPVLPESKQRSSVVYDKFEEEMFANEATLQFTFALPQQNVESAAMPAARAVNRHCKAMFVPKGKLPTVVKKISGFLASFS